MTARDGVATEGSINVRTLENAEIVREQAAAVVSCGQLFVGNHYL